MFLFDCFVLFCFSPYMLILYLLFLGQSPDLSPSAWKKVFSHFGNLSYSVEGFDYEVMLMVEERRMGHKYSKENCWLSDSVDSR